MGRCSICGRRITKGFSLCSDCESDYGKKVADRPEWANFMVNDNQNERRHHKSIAENETQFLDLSKKDQRKLGIQDLY